ncbi:MAG: ligase-associated DNA damage response endonuclease PdeM, partial [Pseudomonadota bacterium]
FLLPPYDTRETLMRLAAVIDRYQPDTVVSLGDSFHDAGGCERLQDADLAIIEVMQEACEWIWVTGNHDPEISARVGGTVTDDVVISGLTLRHEPRNARETHEIAGHLHPAAKLNAHGATLRRSCFISDGQRLIMPAFGAYTGGLNVMDGAFQRLFADGFSVWMRGAEGLYPVPTRQLVGD